MRRALAVVVVGLGLVAGACGNGGDGSSRPGSASGDLPLLPLAGGGGAGGGVTGEAAAMRGAVAEDADAATSMIAPDGPYQPIEYRLGENVPDLDGSHAAYTLDVDVSKEDVRRLVDAFELEGEPVQEGLSWVVTVAGRGGADRVLRVEADGSWYLYDNSAMASDVAVACAPDETCEAPAPPTTAPSANLPSKADAETRAREVLDAGGVDVGDAKPVIQEVDNAMSVQFPVEIDGVPVDGLASTVAVGEGGRIVMASARFGAPTKVGDYPLAGTKAAFERGHNQVTAQGAAEPAIAREDPSYTPPAPQETLPPKIITLTKAEIVYVLEYGRCPGDAVYVVPAYRFSADSPDEPWYGPVPAVADEYLQSAAGDPDRPASSDEAIEPCPGEGAGRSEPGREPEQP